MRSFTLIILCFLLPIILQAQLLPETRITNWNEVGIKEDVSSISLLSESIENTIDLVSDLNGDNSGDSDNAELLNFALKDLPKPVVIYFKPGT